MIRLAVLIALCLPCGIGVAQGQAKTYVTKKDDTLLTMGEALRPPQATSNQMALALYQGNLKTYQSRTTLQLPAGTKLNVPIASIATGTNAQTAETEVAKIWRADQHYRAALILEKSGNMLYAFDTYVYAAKLGHGRAQLRLGQLYDKDMSGFIQRDLQESLQWYEKARENQVDVPKSGARQAGGSFRP
jgi:TPR repeat protein